MVRIRLYCIYNIFRGYRIRPFRDKKSEILGNDIPDIAYRNYYIGSIRFGVIRYAYYIFMGRRSWPLCESVSL